jgi:hypothetical protein
VGQRPCHPHRFEGNAAVEIHPVISILDTISFLLVTTDLYGERIGKRFFAHDPDTYTRAINQVRIKNIGAYFVHGIIPKNIIVGSVICLFGMILFATFVVDTFWFLFMFLGIIDSSVWSSGIHDRFISMLGIRLYILGNAAVSIVVALIGLGIFLNGLELGGAIWFFLVSKILSHRPIKRVMIVLGTTLFIFTRFLDASGKF